MEEKLIKKGLNVILEINNKKGVITNVSKRIGLNKNKFIVSITIRFKNGQIQNYSFLEFNKLFKLNNKNINKKLTDEDKKIIGKL